MQLLGPDSQAELTMHGLTRHPSEVYLTHRQDVAGCLVSSSLMWFFFFLIGGYMDDHIATLLITEQALCKHAQQFPFLSSHRTLFWIHEMATNGTVFL